MESVVSQSTTRKRDVVHAYKFMYEEHLDGFLTGNSVRVGTFADYRQMEKNTGGIKGLGDQLEGTSINFTDVVKSSNDKVEYSNAVRVAGEMGINVVGKHNFNISHNILHQTIPNSFIFCASYAFNNIVINRMRSDSSAASPKGTPYNVVVPIQDIKGFGLSILEALARKFGKPFVGLISKHDKVTYTALTNNLRLNSVVRPSAFKKEISFATQQEYRFVFDGIRPAQDQLAVNLSVNFPPVTLGRPIFLK